jgi:hypothetical protein
LETDFGSRFLVDEFDPVGYHGILITLQSTQSQYTSQRLIVIAVVC